MPQFMATEMRVVKIPWGVVLQPTVSITEEGQTIRIRSMPSTVKIPNTPNHRSVSTAKETIRPMDAPMTAATRVVKKPPLREPQGPCFFPLSSRKVSARLYSCSRGKAYVHHATERCATHVLWKSN